MKATVERHIKQTGNFYQVYAHSLGVKSIIQCFAFDGERWPESEALKRAIELADKIANTAEVTPSVEEVYDTEWEKEVALRDYYRDKSE